MNENQKKLLIAVLCAVVLMLLFPPFQWRHPNGAVFNVGYGLIFSPPKSSYGQAGSVNIGLLVVEWIGALIIGGIGFLLLKEK